MEGGKKLLCLVVTEEQESAIEGIFTFHGWSLDRADGETHKSYSTAVTSDTENSASSIDVNSHIHADNLRCDQSDDSDLQGTSRSCGPMPENHEIDDRSTECPHCFCNPCITNETNRQLWWPVVNSQPHERNRGIRNKVYKKFWSMMQNRYMWTEPRYTARKMAALRRDPKRKHYKWHKRDIMPNCILLLTTSWFPKTKSEEYVGHSWGDE